MATPFTNTTGSATIGASEFSLVNASTSPATATVAAELEVWLDLGAMAAGDQYRVRLVEKAGGGSQLVAFEGFPLGAQPGIYVLPPRRVGEGWDVRVTKIAGTDRAIRWGLRADVGDRNALTIAAAAGAAVWAVVAETGETFGDAIRLLTARLVGAATVQDGDGTYTFLSRDGLKQRIIAARSGSARTVSTRDGT